MYIYVHIIYIHIHIYTYIRKRKYIYISLLFIYMNVHHIHTRAYVYMYICYRTVLGVVFTLEEDRKRGGGERVKGADAGTRVGERRLCWRREGQGTIGRRGKGRVVAQRVAGQGGR